MVRMTITTVVGFSCLTGAPSAMAQSTIPARNVEFTQSGIGAMPTTVQSKLQEAVSICDFGACSDGYDDTAAIQAAIDAVEAEGGGVLFLPRGTYNITNLFGNPYGLRIDSGNVHLIGEGPENTKIVYESLADSRPAILVSSADNVWIQGLHVDGTTNSNGMQGTVNAANCVNVHFQDSDWGRVLQCKLEGGHHGVAFTDDTSGTSVRRLGTNQNPLVRDCIAENCASTGFYFHGASFALVAGNTALDCGIKALEEGDGFKFGGDTHKSRIVGNHASGSGRDGFDFFDGLIECTVVGNVATNNTLNGYEVKGQPGTPVKLPEDAIRHSTISGNLAEGNGVHGFSIASARYTSFTGNSSVSNEECGFSIVRVRGCTFSANIATRNTMHGFSLSDNVRGTSFVGCLASDNSWAGGSSQNGTYHGFSIDPGSYGIFSGCNSFNSPAGEPRGGQGYGFYFGATGSVVQGSDFGGDDGNFYGETNDWTDNYFDMMRDQLGRVRRSGEIVALKFKNGETTPAVNVGGTVFQTSKEDCTITDFDLGYEGQEITVLILHENTVFDFGSPSLSGNGGLKWTGGPGDSVRCVAGQNASTWHCFISEG